MNYSILTVIVFAFLSVGRSDRCMAAENVEKSVEKPNVIFVLTDDQGYGDLSCHGNPTLKTPAIDRLHSQSLRFTNYHVCPMCTPTRGELMTGIDAFRNGASAVCEGRSMPRHELAMMPQFFQASGYATGHFGKWHLGDSYPFRPHDRGFDNSIHNKAWGVSSLAEYWKNDCVDDHYWHNNQLKQYKGYNTDVFFNEAMSWMKKQNEQKKPFFVYLPTTAAHSPFNVGKKFSTPYKKNGAKVGSFFGMIANIDENMARLETFLEKQHLKKNTILIFMSDNGTVAGDKVFNAGMRGKKQSEYDGGHRVPFFLRWPAAGWDKPRDINRLTRSTDLLPTLIDLCHLQSPRMGYRKVAKFDGHSLKPLLDGKTPQTFTDRKTVIQYRAEFKKWSGAVLWNNWRLVNGTELYDIQKDPGQKKNVYQQNPVVVKALRDYYEQWATETQKIMNQKNYFIAGTPHEKVTWLSSCNWTGSYCDNLGNLSKNRFGHWNVQAESAGNYELSLYLFHPDAKAVLKKSFRHPAGKTFKARPIAQARLIIDGKATTVKTAKGDTHATFTISLKKGQKIKLEAQFLSAAGKPICGAYYTFMRKK